MILLLERAGTHTETVIKFHRVGEQKIYLFFLKSQTTIESNKTDLKTYLDSPSLTSNYVDKGTTLPSMLHLELHTKQYTTN